MLGRLGGELILEDNKSNEQGEISSNYQMMGMSMGMCFGIPIGMLLGMLAGAAKDKKVNGQPVY